MTLGYQVFSHTHFCSGAVEAMAVPTTPGYERQPDYVRGCSECGAVEVGGTDSLGRRHALGAPADRAAYALVTVLRSINTDEESTVSVGRTLLETNNGRVYEEDGGLCVNFCDYDGEAYALSRDEVRELRDTLTKWLEHQG